jgi:hypothetical protein
MSRLKFDFSNRFSYRTLQSASTTFSLDYFTDAAQTLQK